MDIEKYVKKDIRISIAFIIVGILAGISGFLFKFQKDMMSDLALVCITVGTGMLILYKYSLKKLKYRKNIELEHEERNTFINTKAGQTAYWISYFYIFAAIVFNNVIKLSFVHFLIITLIFMSTVYFIFVIIFHKRY